MLKLCNAINNKNKVNLIGKNALCIWPKLGLNSGLNSHFNKYKGKTIKSRGIS